MLTIGSVFSICSLDTCDEMANVCEINERLKENKEYSAKINCYEIVLQKTAAISKFDYYQPIQICITA